MKQIDKFVLKSFIPPYIMSFFVAEFVLLMQFLWKYIDEILGKGFSFGVLIELIFYFGVTIIPMAIPITILISSVMVFGNMAEKFELSSFKSSGISLMRIMACGIGIAILTSMFSLFASNYLKPKANYKFLERFNSVRKQKPALSLEASVYNKDFSGYAIWIGSKDKDGVGINDVLVYDNSSNDKSLVNFVKADRGKMYSDENTGSFVMNLIDGEQYREMKQKKQGKSKKADANPFMRTRFSTWKKVFDLSEFDMDAQSLNLSRKKYDLLNCFQLTRAIDTLAKQRKIQRDEHIENYKDLIGADVFTALDIDMPKNKKHLDKIDRDKEKKKQKSRTARIKVKQIDSLNLDTTSLFINTFDQRVKKELATSLSSVLNSKNDRLAGDVSKSAGLYKDWANHQLRLHQQFSWAMICIIFLFIGGPFGSIVRKGGYGYPLLIAIIFFVLFIIFNIAGEKLNKSVSIHPILAAWLPCLVLLPFAFWFTIKAVNDRSLSLPSFNWFKKNDVIEKESEDII